MSFEKENEERRIREQIRENLIKHYGANNIDEVFYVGSPDLMDDYTGKPIYLAKELKNEEADLNMGDHNQAESSNEEAEKTTELSDTEQGMSEADIMANEIYQRLMAEAAADEKARQDEIESVKREVEKGAEISVYSSGSPSANYGQKPMSQSDSDAFDSIMNNNRSFSKSIEELISENQ